MATCMRMVVRLPRAPRLRRWARAVLAVQQGNCEVGWLSLTSLRLRLSRARSLVPSRGSKGRKSGAQSYLESW